MSSQAWGLVLLGVCAIWGYLIIRARKPMPATRLTAPGHKIDALRPANLNYLIPDETDEPLVPREAYVSGITRMGLCGIPRQEVIASAKMGEEVLLVRMPDNEHDPNAIVVYRANGQDLGWLAKDDAAEIAPRLDRGSPVTAKITAFEPLSDRQGKDILGVHLELVPHKLKPHQRRKRKS